jgi:hypothetical protein
MNGIYTKSRIIKLPLKIKIFVSFLLKEVILTKDNLIKRNWKGDGRCFFLQQRDHPTFIFIDCHVTRFIWRVVEVVFGVVGTPTRMANFLGVWLQQETTFSNLWEQVHLFGLIDWAEMMLYSHLHLFLGLHTGRASRPYSKRKATYQDWNGHAKHGWLSCQGEHR